MRFLLFPHVPREIWGSTRTFQTPQRATEAGKQHGRDGNHQQPLPSPHLLSLPVISQRLRVSGQDPWESCGLLSCALPYLRSIFHVSRSHVSGYWWPQIPGSDGLAAPRASPPKHRQEPKSLPLCKQTPCLSFPAGKSEGKESPFFLNTWLLLRQTNAIKEGLRGLIRLHGALEILSFTEYDMEMAAVTRVLHAASLMQPC